MVLICLSILRLRLRPSGTTRHHAAVYAVAFRHDGERMATASFDHTIKVWDVDSGRVVRPSSAIRTKCWRWLTARRPPSGLGGTGRYRSGSGTLRRASRHCRSAEIAAFKALLSRRMAPTDRLWRGWRRRGLEDGRVFPFGANHLHWAGADAAVRRGRLAGWPIARSGGSGWPHPAA